MSALEKANFRMVKPDSCLRCRYYKIIRLEGRIKQGYCQKHNEEIIKSRDMFDVISFLEDHICDSFEKNG